MVGFLPMKMKMKRKELEEVNDDFSDFSLSSPARKIRRLDAELPPIMEEEEPESSLLFKPSMPHENVYSNVGVVAEGGPIIEELPAVSKNEERAIVLFKPVNTQLLQSPSGFTVYSDLISGFKNQVLWSRNSNLPTASEDEAERQDEDLDSTNECLAVVPWVPSELPPLPGTEGPQTDDYELMEAEEMEVATMDIEDNHIGVEQMSGNNLGGMSVGEGVQWQQHCMVPQPPENTSTPIVWFR